MKFLIDKSKKDVTCKRDRFPSLVAGQLCTPLTSYRNWGGTFAIDNGAYSGLDRKAFFATLEKQLPFKDRCLFVAVPDIVGNARRTHELYGMITQAEEMKPWTKLWAYVMQDGHEDLHINWYEINTVFIGGSTQWKDSSAAQDIVKTAKALNIPVHVGRVNTTKRYIRFAELGADTCDGSGVAMYDHMLQKISSDLTVRSGPTLFDGETE